MSSPKECCSFDSKSDKHKHKVIPGKALTVKLGIKSYTFV